MLVHLISRKGLKEQPEIIKETKAIKYEKKMATLPWKWSTRTMEWESLF
uniref:Uncharacterized protein n=1 Tax=Arundo donax TaxID=35708 RepID=A0A0A8ZBD2_ARUDO